MRSSVNSKLFFNVYQSSVKISDSEPRKPGHRDDREPRSPREALTPAEKRRVLAREDASPNPSILEMGDRLSSIRAQSAKAEQTGREEGQR
jgi:hypothetical protein